MGVLDTVGKAWVRHWDNAPEGTEYLLACGGTDDNPHMVEMDMVWEAATPYGVCPNCGSRAFLHPSGPSQSASKGERHDWRCVG